MLKAAGQQTSHEPSEVTGPAVAGIATHRNRSAAGPIVPGVSSPEAWGLINSTGLDPLRWAYLRQRTKMQPLQRATGIRSY